MHLNGAINSLNEAALNSSFKLSNSSYIAPDSFTTSKWSYPFKRDLERASAIVFVGYSLYDIEIQKILFENPEFKAKTYFVTRRDPDSKLTFILSSFGHVLPLSCEGFGDLLRDELSGYREFASPVFTTAFARYELLPSDAELRDSNIEKFLMHGDIADHFIDRAIGGIQEAPFLILRSELDKAKEFALRGTHVVITSDFGNGKSVLLKMIRASLTSIGRNTYDLVDIDDDYIADLEKLVAAATETYLIVDDYDRCFDVVEYCANFKPTNIRLILAARTSNHERCRAKLDAIDFSYAEIGVDTLSEPSAVQFVDILDNVGIWGQNAALSRSQKISKVVRERRSHISSTLLAIFEAPQMKARIAALLAPLMARPAAKDTIFSI